VLAWVADAIEPAMGVTLAAILGKLARGLGAVRGSNRLAIGAARARRPCRPRAMLESTASSAFEAAGAIALGIPRA
jgi:hypothetical protein